MQEMVSNHFQSSSSYCLKSLEEKQELNYGSLFTKERISVQVLERAAQKYLKSLLRRRPMTIDIIDEN